MTDIKKNIIMYLESKGKIKACLLHKLINHFCSLNSKFKIKKIDLLFYLFSLLKEKKIEIIIVEPFDIDWKKKKIYNSTFLKDGEYYVRTFKKGIYKKIGDLPETDYLFDTRKMNIKNTAEMDKICNWLLELIINNNIIKYNMIIYYPSNSNKLKIHESLKTSLKINHNVIDPPSNLIYKGPKLKFDLEKQKLNLMVIKAYRSKYMCFYITLIESIHQEIVKFQVQNRNYNEHPKKLKAYIEKFGYYCINFVKSDWVEIKKSNPYRWETFFKLFKLPIKILNLEIKTIRFHGRTFETLDRFKFCIYIKKSQKAIISRLKNIGYEEFTDLNKDKFTAIGLDQIIYLPCPSIEYFYFIAKYICFFHLFLLLYHSFEYIKENFPDIRLTFKEKMLFKLFFPVMDGLFKVSKEIVSNSLVFKYYTLNPDELEVIYNNLMVNNVRIIESKMIKYFLIKHSSCTIMVDNK